MSLPSLAMQTTASPPPTQMIEFQWVLNAETGYYDIINEFTPSGNQGNLQVIQSKILITLNTFQGEWQPQPDFGIPFNSINENSDNPDVLSQIIVNEILTVQNVNSVVVQNFEYIPTTRMFNATYLVNTIFGVFLITTGQTNAS